MNKLTADTNIFFYLGHGVLKKGEIVEDGWQLCASPTNVLEILAGASSREWAETQAAARGIDTFADEIRPDTETHLVSLFGAAAEFDTQPWTSGCRAVALANSLEEAEEGVEDLEAGVVRKVNFDLAKATKDHHYEDFFQQMVAACEEHVPGYKDAIEQKKNLPIPARPEKQKYRDLLKSEPMFAVIFDTLLQRCQLITGARPQLDGDALTDAIEATWSYLAVYSCYLSEILTTGRKPAPNDFGDLELFLYAQPGDRVITAEKKWATFAANARVDDLVSLANP